MPHPAVGLGDEDEGSGWRKRFERLKRRIMPKFATSLPRLSMPVERTAEAIQHLVFHEECQSFLIVRVEIEMGRRVKNDPPLIRKVHHIWRR